MSVEGAPRANETALGVGAREDEPGLEERDHEQQSEVDEEDELQPTAQPLQAAGPAWGRARIAGVWRIVGFLVAVELVSGVLQGYYTPVFTDVARHLDIRDADVN